MVIVQAEMVFGLCTFVRHFGGPNIWRVGKRMNKRISKINFFHLKTTFYGVSNISGDLYKSLYYPSFSEDHDPRNFDQLVTTELPARPENHRSKNSGKSRKLETTASIRILVRLYQLKEI